ncbi:MAG: tricarballylate utilization 4Fe-4S protein TcuB [Burkholderiaceae bacterium]|nr:tricarballylate utilization 4Fe-4S protein TcuB [Burkholderiaceae bacterium]
MSPLEALVEEAEAARVLGICNACRYCEGFCAVFPATFRRLEFGPRDVHYLANLCHQCGACLHACQYAPPHEFALNVPQAMARVRVKTWSEYAWPRALGSLYQRNGLVLSLALAATIASFLALVMASAGSLWAVPDGGFYALVSHEVMVGLFAPVFGWAVAALMIGVTRFWRSNPPGPSSVAAMREAAGDVLSLKYLGGGHGDGCNNSDDAFSLVRRRFHHATFYGFMLCFAATSVATLYHYVGDMPAPYGFTSLPKILGMGGGVLLVVGTVGLFWLNLTRHPLQGAPERKSMDLGFIALLGLTAATGLALALLGRQTALPLLLALHLGAVMALFATMPYSKFAHGIYRSAALLRWAVEKRGGSEIKLTSE